MKETNSGSSLVAYIFFPVHEIISIAYFIIFFTYCIILFDASEILARTLCLEDIGF